MKKVLHHPPQLFQPDNIPSHRPVRNVRKTRLESLPPDQLAKLNQWLFEDELTYHEVRRRLFQSFGLKLNVGRLCQYWQKRMRPGARPETSATPVVLNVIVESPRPVHVQILSSRVNVRTQIQK